MNTENLIDLTAITARSRTKKILIVEDEPMWQTIISKTLRSVDKDIGVRCVRSVKHAQQILYTDRSYDMVIADHYLEGSETGLDLWRDCKEEYRPIPFVVVTGLKEEKFRALVDSTGHIAPIYMEKPFEIERLRKLIGIQLGTPVRPNAERIRKVIMSCSLILASIALPFTIDESPLEQKAMEQIGQRSATPRGESRIKIENKVEVSRSPRLEHAGRKAAIDQIITVSLRRQLSRVLKTADEINEEIAEKMPTVPLAGQPHF